MELLSKGYHCNITIWACWVSHYHAKKKLLSKCFVIQLYNPEYFATRCISMRICALCNNFTCWCSLINKIWVPGSRCTEWVSEDVLVSSNFIPQVNTKQQCSHHQDLPSEKVVAVMKVVYFDWGISWERPDGRWDIMLPSMPTKLSMAIVGPCMMLCCWTEEVVWSTL